MLIISKYKDYYDIVQGQGVDKTLIYKRDEKEIFVNYDKSFDVVGKGFVLPQEYYEFVAYFDTLPHRFYIWKSKMEAEPFIVGFCGQIYLGYKMSLPTGEKEICYNVYSIIEFMKTHKLYEQLDEFSSPEKKSKYGRTKSKYRPFKFDEVKNAFDEVKDNKFLHSLFVEYKAPIFYFERMYRGAKFHINAQLKDLDFHIKVSHYQAFQEISMYLGGVLGVGSPEMIDISDKEMIKKKGFDKFSFRKAKQH